MDYTKLPGYVYDPMTVDAPPPPGQSPQALGGTTKAGVLGRGAIRGAAPAAVGLAAFGPAFTAGAAATAPFAPAAGPFAPAVPIVGGMVTGLAASLPAAYYTAQYQEKKFEENPELARALGQSAEQRAIDMQEHPYVAIAGELAPNLVAFRPSFSTFANTAKLAATKEAEALARGALPAAAKAQGDAARAAVYGQRINAVMNAGIGGSIDLAQQMYHGGPIDLTQTAMAAGMGLLGQKETFLGRGITKLSNSIVPQGIRARAEAALGRNVTDEEPIFGDEDTAVNPNEAIDPDEIIEPGQTAGGREPLRLTSGLAPPGTARPDVIYMGSDSRVPNLGAPRLEWDGAIKMGMDPRPAPTPDGPPVYDRTIREPLRLGYDPTVESQAPGRNVPRPLEPLSMDPNQPNPGQTRVPLNQPVQPEVSAYRGAAPELPEDVSSPLMGAEPEQRDMFFEKPTSTVITDFSVPQVLRRIRNVYGSGRTTADMLKGAREVSQVLGGHSSTKLQEYIKGLDRQERALETAAIKPETIENRLKMIQAKRDVVEHYLERMADAASQEVPGMVEAGLARNSARAAAGEAPEAPPVYGSRPEEVSVTEQEMRASNAKQDAIDRSIFTQSVHRGNQNQKMAARRDRILQEVLADDNTVNPVERFRAALAKNGIRDMILTPEEKAKVARFQELNQDFKSQPMQEEMFNRTEAPEIDAPEGTPASALRGEEPVAEPGDGPDWLNGELFTTPTNTRDPKTGRVVKQARTAVPTKQALGETRQQLVNEANRTLSEVRGKKAQALQQRAVNAFMQRGAGIDLVRQTRELVNRRKYAEAEQAIAAVEPKAVEAPPPPPPKVETPAAPPKAATPPPPPKAAAAVEQSKAAAAKPPELPPKAVAAVSTAKGKPAGEKAPSKLSDFDAETQKVIIDNAMRKVMRAENEGVIDTSTANGLRKMLLAKDASDTIEGVLNTLKTKQAQWENRQKVSERPAQKKSPDDAVAEEDGEFVDPEDYTVDSDDATGYFERFAGRDEGYDDGRLKSGDSDGTGMSAKSAQTVVDNVTKNWSRKAKIQVVESVDQLPSKYRRVPRDTLGFYGKDGELYIVAGNHATASSIKATVFHEALGHYGLQGKFGKTLNKILADAYETNPRIRDLADKWVAKQMADADAKAYYSKLSPEQLRRVAVEEVLARASEDGPVTSKDGLAGVFEKIVAAVRDFARRLGMKVDYSDADISDILARAHDYAMRGDGDVRGGSDRLHYVGKDAKLDKKTRVQEGIAKVMDSVGIEQNTIRQTTGWHKGSDGQWRFEIDSSKMKVKTDSDLSDFFVTHDLDKVMLSNAGSAKLRKSLATNKLAKMFALNQAERRIEMDGRARIKAASSFEEETAIRKEMAELKRQAGDGAAVIKTMSNKELKDLADKSLSSQDLTQVLGLESHSGYHYTTLDKLIDYPELFKAYPELAKMRVGTDLSGSNYQGASLDTSRGFAVIEINGKSSTGDKLKSTLAHEIQHYIQLKEGFANGSGPDQTYAQVGMSYDKLGKSKFVDNMIRMVSDPKNPLFDAQYDVGWKAEFTKLKELGERMHAAYVKKSNKYSELRQEFTDTFADIKKEFSADLRLYRTQYQQTEVPGLDLFGYGLLRGEAEARDVQKRIDLTPEQRKTTVPFSKEFSSPDGYGDMFRGEKGPRVAKNSSLEEYESWLTNQTYDGSEFHPINEIEGVGSTKPAAAEAVVDDLPRLRTKLEENADSFFEKVPEQARGPLQRLFDNLSYVGKRGITSWAFTPAVVDDAVKSGVKSARDYMRSMLEREKLKKDKQIEVEGILNRFEALPENLKGTGKKSVNNMIFKSTTKSKWAFKPDWIPNFSEKMIDPALKAEFDAMPKEAQQVIKDVFKYGNDTLRQMKNGVMESVAGEYRRRLSTLAEPMVKVFDDALAARAATNPEDAVLTAMEQVSKAVKGTEHVEAFKAIQSALKADTAKFHKMMNLHAGLPYAPIRRFGKYVVVGRSKDYEAMAEKVKAGEEKQGKLDEMKAKAEHYFVDFAQTAGEAKGLVRDLNKQFGEGKVTFFEKENAGQLGGDRDLYLAFQRLQHLLTENYGDTQDKSTLNATRQMVGDLYLSTLIDNSSRKSEYRRLNVPGREMDMMRAFASKGLADAHFVGNLYKNNDVLKSLGGMRKEAREGGNEGRAERQMYVNELLARHAMTMNSPNMTIANVINRGSSMYFLAMSPGYYLQNLAQPLMMSVPYMAGRHDYGMTLNAMSKAYKDLAPMLAAAKATEPLDLAKNIPADVQNTLRELILRGQIDIGIDTDLGTWASQGNGNLTKHWNNVDRGLRNLVQKTETMNRLATGIAAYRVEMAKLTAESPRMSAAERESIAMEYASDVIRTTHGNYDAFSAPRYFNAPTGKVLLQFRKFQLMQIAMLAKLTKNSFADGPEALIARKALGYTLGHTATMAGLLGLPGMTAIQWLYKQFAGDEDHPADMELELRKAIGDDETAQLLLKGVPNAIGLNLSDRLGMGNAFSLMPYTDVNKVDRDTYKDVLLGAAGPFVGGLLPRAFDAIGKMHEGNYYKGLEMMLPNGLPQGAARAYRYGDEGITQANGRTLIPPEDVETMTQFYTALGLPSTQVSNQQWARHLQREYNEFYVNRAKRVKQDYLEARKSNDPKKVKAAVDAWKKLQDARVENGLKRQPLDQLFRAYADARKAERNTKAGIAYTRQDKQLASELADLTAGESGEEARIQ